ncbi:MAG: hypothetical protein U0836_03235 [Pirellulales bacterium]
MRRYLIPERWSDFVPAIAIALGSAGIGIPAFLAWDRGDSFLFAFFAIAGAFVVSSAVWKTWADRRRELRAV